ncbi:MAG: VWA domain-containing protein [Phycisphaerales bacterium]|nr:VWA domain-containing protein [Phycisphaerales bacterium]
MSGLSFDDLRYLHLGWVVAVVALAGVLAIVWRRVLLRRFADKPLLARLAPPAATGRAVLRLALVAAALLLLVAALTGPRWGERTQTMIRRNLDVVVLLDVSRSMLARDIAPSRLERAKLAIRDDLLPALGGDRVGLVAFAGGIDVVCPLTSDYGFFRLALADVSPQSAPRGGSLIGDALRKVAGQFERGPDTHRVVLLITDGEDQDSEPVAAAANLWQDAKIAVVAVVLGDPEIGARIPIAEGGRQSYLTYKDEEVWSKANFETVKKIAEASPLGVFVPVGTSNFDLGAIFRRIASAIRASEIDEQRLVQQPARFHPFVVAALALVLIDSFLRDGPRAAAGVVAVPRAGRRREEAA